MSQRTLWRHRKVPSQTGFECFRTMQRVTHRETGGLFPYRVRQVWTHVLGSWNLPSSTCESKLSRTGGRSTLNWQLERLCSCCRSSSAGLQWLGYTSTQLCNCDKIPQVKALLTGFLGKPKNKKAFCSFELDWGWIVRCSYLHSNVYCHISCVFSHLCLW